MALGQGYDYPVSDKIPEAVKIVLYLGVAGISAVCFAVVINVFQDRTVEFFLRAYERFDTPLECECKKRVFLHLYLLTYLRAQWKRIL